MDVQGHVARGGTYAVEREGTDDLTGQVIAAAIDVHRAIGPGMLESVYQACLSDELRQRAIAFEEEVALPITYRGRVLKERFRLDFVVESRLIVEIKSVERLLQVHHAQLLTYLRLGGFRRGLLINFNVPRLVLGVRRVAN